MGHEGAEGEQMYRIRPAGPRGPHRVGSVTL